MQTRNSVNYERIANGLGWFSLGLGIVEMAAPGTVNRMIGIRDSGTNRNLLRSPLYGMREVAAGVGILTQPGEARWLWSRVAGDVMDLGTLAKAMTCRENDRAKVTGAALAVLGVTALDYYCAQQLSKANGRAVASGLRTAQRATYTVTVNKPVDEVYWFWRRLENLPRFMRHLESVEDLGGNRSRWRSSGPMGKTLEWEAEIVADEPGKRISWRSLEGASVHNAGSVTFESARGNRGTVVRVEMCYDPPGGKAGAMVAKLFGKDAGQMMSDDLRAFKQVMETGEVIQSDASIHYHMHPAQPPKEVPAI